MATRPTIVSSVSERCLLCNDETHMGHGKGALEGGRAMRQRRRVDPVLVQAL